MCSAAVDTIHGAFHITRNAKIAQQFIDVLFFPKSACKQLMPSRTLFLIFFLLRGSSCSNTKTNFDQVELHSGRLCASNDEYGGTNYEGNLTEKL
jgi:hypothetical protein